MSGQLVVHKSEMSQFYTDKQLNNLNRLGDVIIPKSPKFPSFSEVGCVAYVDDVMASAKPQDIKDFGMLLTIMTFMPKFMIGWLVSLGINANKMPEFIAPLLRQLDIGLRGVIYTLYYSNVVAEGYTGYQPNEVIGFDIKCDPDP